MMGVTKCSALLMVLAAVLLGPARGARRKSGRSQPDASLAASGVKTIAGVPVHNYHLAHQSSHATALLELGTEAAAIEEHWIVVFKPDSTDARIEEFCARDQSHEKCYPVGHPSEGGVAFADVDGSEQDLEALFEGRQDEIDFVEPDLLTFAIPEMSVDEEEEEEGEAGSQDTSMLQESSRPWGLSKIGISGRAHSGRGVHVYVLDTGIRTTHGDFRGRAIPTLEVTSHRPRECRGSASCAVDRQGHGTHCAGTAGGSQYGVANEATVHAVKVLGDDGSGYNSWTVTALDWLATRAQRPAVASMSLGSEGTSRADKVAVNQAVKAGITVVVAAGNENANACGYSPAFVPETITVGATDSRNRRASYSNFGSCVDIFAPGSNIMSAGHRSDRDSTALSGTSMACPHVTGAAALLLQEDPTLTPGQVEAKIKASSKSGLVTGLTRSDSNLLLHIGSSTGGGGGVPSSGGSRPGQCPSSARSATPDSDGDCRCKETSYCYTGYSKGCACSMGARCTSYFSQTCTSCRCLSR